MNGVSKLGAAAAAVLMLAACGGSSNSVKTVSELTEVEKGGLDKLMLDIYDEVGPPRSGCFTYETEYNVRPLEDGSYGEKLATPVKLLSRACVGPLMLLPETMAKLREAMKNKSVTWTGPDGRKMRLSIAEGYLVPTPGGGGGGDLMSNDMVTIYPTKIEIGSE